MIVCCMCRCEEELRTCRSSVEARLTEEKRIALERQLIELTGTAEEKAAALEAKAKEERVELLRRQVGRRMMHSAISAGWSAWYELWTSRTDALRHLRHCANMLRAPALLGAFAFWSKGAAVLRVQAAASANLRAREEELVQERAALEAELLSMQHACDARLAAAAEEKRLALERQLVELTGSAEEQIAMRQEKDREARVELLRRQSMRRMMNASVANAWSV